ncbi:Leucine-rich repeat (LRR) protein [Pseudomonas sp. EB276 TE3739]|uniref:leucine-rich repeat domain-containing protein n=1 Tax=Pseudomonas TaxID=286 RepID=UPI00209D50FE|nr:leucine-rich repeat domain-containing protein [Pseudomonas koreensis]MCP1473961.1 Leucine-rich repeat (LRR) protein [Pseudomonas koreensis]
MPVKPPRRGGTHVDLPISPTRSTDVDTSLPGPLRQTGFDSSSAPGNPPLRAAVVGAPHPSPAVVVHAAQVDARLPKSLPSLDHYVSAVASLPQANSEGLRVFRQRTYAEVSDGRIVLVAIDSETGLFRARLPSELSPSGPVLLRDTGSGLWRLREVSVSTSREQVRKYLPDATDQHADDFIFRFADSEAAEAELKRIELGYPQLERELLAWADASKGSDVETISGRGAMAAELRRLYKWQGTADERVYHDGRFRGFNLDVDLSLWPSNPTLSAQFSSVASLTLRGDAQMNPEIFLSQFPEIETFKTASLMRLGRGSGLFRTIHYSRFRLEPGIIEHLAKRPRLREMNLQDCIIEPGFSLLGMPGLQVLKINNVQGTVDFNALVNEVSGLSRLQVLDLHQNPLMRAAPRISGMPQLRILDLTDTGIRRLPVGLGSDNGTPQLQVLRLGANPLSDVPSLEGMSALQQLDLSGTGISRFPDGISSTVPGEVLNVAGNRIESIPEFLELRAGFNLGDNPITDPASLRRLIRARRKTGSDLWLGEASIDPRAYLWLRNVPQEQIPGKLALWDRQVAALDRPLNRPIRMLSRTPEFQVERQLLQRRVWAFLESYDKAALSERARLDAIAINETSPGRMLERLEEELRASDPGRQNDPLHHLPKRPKLE